MGINWDEVADSADRGSEDFVPLPYGTRVVAKVESVTGKRNANGRPYAEVVSKTVSIQAGVPDGNYGHPKFWDRFNFTLPEDPAAFAGQPEETVAKKRKALEIFKARTKALGLTLTKDTDLDTPEAIGAFFAGAIGTEVIIKTKLEAATLNEDGTVKYRAKSVPNAYDPVTPERVKKYGFVNEGVSF